uniref:Uncharacterized protein n=1 Tax=Gadus morhua TaxID=8049 RepID=A0A8C5BD35_GADMO
MTSDASLRARDAFISPSLLLNLPCPSAPPTLALASRLASASAAMARCSWWGSLTSLISTRSTLMPHWCAASSRDPCRARSSWSYTPALSSCTI